MANTEFEDVELIRNYKNGDKTSGEIIIQKYYKYVYRMTFRWAWVSIDSKDAEDLTQKTFEKFIKALFAYDERFSSPKTWIMNIGRNTVIDHIRGKKKVVELPVLEARSSQFMDTLKREIFQKARQILSIKELMTYELLVQGYTQEEMAEKMKIPLGSIKTICLRSMKKLRESVYPPSAESSIPKTSESRRDRALYKKGGGPDD